jgi:hypothetical protein
MAHITGKTFTLTHLENAAVATPHTANVGGTQFVYVSYNGGTTGGNIRVYSVAADGALTFLEDVPASAENGLSGAWEMETFTIGDTTFLAAVGQRADSLTIFAASKTAPFLEHVDTVFDSDDTRYELDNARYLSVHQIGGNTFLAATSVPWWGAPDSHDDGITVFRVADDGTLTFASAFDAVDGVSSNSGWPSDTFEADGNYYFAVGASKGQGFAIMRIDPQSGEIEAAAPNVGSDQAKFATAQISVHMADDVPYLFVPTRAGILYVYTYDGGTDAVLVTSVTLPESYPPHLSAVYEVGDSVIVAVGSANARGDGVLLYDFDATSGTLTEMQWLHGSRSTEPDAQPLEDVSFGPDFMIDGQPYALITSDNDATVNVYAIGGDDDLLTGTSEADLIEGFGGNDTLYGSAGDDTLVGGADFDTARYLDASTEYDVLYDGISDSYMVTALKAGSTEGSDTLHDIEAVSFFDGLFVLAPDGLSLLQPGGPNATLVAVGDLVNTVRNSPVTVAVLENDSDPDSIDTVDLTDIVSGPFVGTALIDAGGTVTYTPLMNWFGTDTFTYEISDAAGDTATANVVVEVAGPTGLTAGDVLFDVAGTKTWNARFDVLDAAFEQVGRTILYDDGRVDEITYTNGVRTTLVRTDLGDAYKWTESIQTWDADGNRLFSASVMDNGLIKEKGFDAGILSAMVQTDTADEFVWAEKTETYDTAGVRATATTVYDDERVFEIEYLNGIRSTGLMTDVADAHSWATKEFFYDIDGRLNDIVVNSDLADIA